MLNELLIKSAVIDRLFEDGALDDAVLVNEMVVANWSRRADLAVANGKLHAFEIKSDLDTLRRLQAQVETYLYSFDKVTVVTTSRFLNVVKGMLPPEVEIWEAEKVHETVSIRIARRGRAIEIRNKRNLCGFLHKPEIVALLRSQGVKSNVGAPREELIKMTEYLQVKKVREYVLKAIKARYRDTFESFVQSRESSTRTGDLDELSKSKLLAKRNQPQEGSFAAKNVLGRPEKKLNIFKLEQKFGRMPENTPQSVLLRVPKHVSR